MTPTPQAYWTVAPGRGELRAVPPRTPGPGEVEVRTLCSGVSRGTELLVHRGGVPATVRDQMRAPHQEGDLPGPVKYGYLSVGVVEAAPSDPALVGRRVFCLYPHQDRYVVPAADVTPVPDAVSSGRAVLAGTVETAVNVVWDAAPRYGDRVMVVGLGMIGASVAGLLRRFPLGRLQIVEPDPARRPVAEALGVQVVDPDAALGDCDLAIHCSATDDGLRLGLDLLGEEGELIEVSWYGDRPVSVPLGGAFHARRLTVRASQVGAVAAARRSRRTFADRLGLALDELADPAYDALLAGPWPFADLPSVMDRLAAGALPGLCHVISYPRS